MIDRPNSVRGSTSRIKTSCGFLYLTISNPDEPYQEVFIRLGKSGGCPAAFLDGVGRLITFAVNGEVKIETIIKAFKGIQCPSPMWSEGVQVLSCLDGVAKLLEGEKKDEGI